MSKSKTQETFTYETKCRKCGSFEEWYFADSSAIDWLNFAKAMHDHIVSPRQKYCNTCEKETVQDVVSYTPH